MGQAPAHTVFPTFSPSTTPRPRVAAIEVNRLPGYRDNSRMASAMTRSERVPP